MINRDSLSASQIVTQLAIKPRIAATRAPHMRYFLCFLVLNQAGSKPMNTPSSAKTICESSEISKKKTIRYAPILLLRYPEPLKLGASLHISFYVKQMTEP